MKKWIATLTLALAPALGSAAILDTGAVQSGTLDNQSGWVNSNGFEVDFWSFSGAAGESVSLFAASEATDVAFSLYADNSTEPAFLNAFSNDSDWDEYPFGSGNYQFDFLASSFGEGDESLLDFILPATGMFTLAIGGEVPDFLAEGSGPFAYSVQLVRNAAQVPLPGAGWLMLSGLAGLLVANRRRTELNEEKAAI